MACQKHGQWWALFQQRAGQEHSVSCMLLAMGYLGTCRWKGKVVGNRGKKGGQLFWSCCFAKFWHWLRAELWRAGLRPPQTGWSCSGAPWVPQGFLGHLGLVATSWQGGSLHPPKPCGVWSAHAQGSSVSAMPQSGYSGQGTGAGPHSREEKAPGEP